MIPTIYFIFPETKGRTLEEIAKVFDGEAASAEVLRQASLGLDEKERAVEKSIVNIDQTKKV